MQDKQYNGFIPSNIDHRLRQLAPATVLAFPMIWHDTNFFTSGNQWAVIFTSLFILIFLSFITETFGEMFERKMRKHHSSTEKFKKYHIKGEWYEYLKREYPGPLIGDKYMGSVVDRMKLRCSTIIPIFSTGVWEGCKENDITMKILYISLGTISAIFLLKAAYFDVVEIINIRKTLINNNRDRHS